MQDYCFQILKVLCIELYNFETVELYNFETAFVYDNMLLLNYYCKKGDYHIRI